MDGTDTIGTNEKATARPNPKRHGTCRAAVLDILFEGRAPSEGRLEALLDRMERDR